MALTEAERILHATTKKKEETEALARRLNEEEEIAHMAHDALQQVNILRLTYPSSDNLPTFIIALTHSLTHALSVIANGRRNASATNQRRSSSSRRC